jgi:hypothetical protein
MWARLDIGRDREAGAQPLAPGTRPDAPFRSLPFPAKEPNFHDLARSQAPVPNAPPTYPGRIIHERPTVGETRHIREPPAGSPLPPVSRGAL